jgi:hypothetical protein
MPSRSKAQRRLMGMALHSPEKLKGKNKGVLKMSDEQLSDFASTKEANLPKKIKKPEAIKRFMNRRNKRRG